MNGVGTSAAWRKHGRKHLGSGKKRHPDPEKDEKLSNPRNDTTSGSPPGGLAGYGLAALSALWSGKQAAIALVLERIHRRHLRLTRHKRLATLSELRRPGTLSEGTGDMIRRNILLLAALLFRDHCDVATLPAAASEALDRTNYPHLDEASR